MPWQGCRVNRLLPPLNQPRDVRLRPNTLIPIDVRICDRTPVLLRMVYKHRDDRRDDIRYDRGAVQHLHAVDRPFPGGATVQHLVSQGVEPIKKDGEHFKRAVFGERFGRLAPRTRHSVRPLRAVKPKAMRIPERLEHVLIAEHAVNLFRVVGPHQVIDHLARIKFNNGAQEPRVRFARIRRLALIGDNAVGGVESDPQKNELIVGKLPEVLVAPEPAQCAADAKLVIRDRRKILRPLPKVRFQLVVAKMIEHINWAVHSHNAQYREKRLVWQMAHPGTVLGSGSYFGVGLQRLATDIAAFMVLHAIEQQSFLAGELAAIMRIAFPVVRKCAGVGQFCDDAQIAALGNLAVA